MLIVVNNLYICNIQNYGKIHKIADSDKNII